MSPPSPAPVSPVGRPQLRPHRAVSGMAVPGGGGVSAGPIWWVGGGTGKGGGGHGDTPVAQPCPRDEGPPREAGWGLRRWGSGSKPEPSGGVPGGARWLWGGLRPAECFAAPQTLAAAQRGHAGTLQCSPQRGMQPPMRQCAPPPMCLHEAPPPSHAATPLPPCTGAAPMQQRSPPCSRAMLWDGAAATAHPQMGGGEVGSEILPDPPPLPPCAIRGVGSCDGCWGPWGCHSGSRQGGWRP